MPFDPDAYLAKKIQEPEKPSQGFDPDAYLAKKSQEPEEGMGQKILGLLGKGANALESYTGAPMRSAISAAQNADTPLDIPGEAVKAGLAQMGKDPSTAPTGEEIVKRAGVSGQSIKLPTPLPGAPPTEVNPSKVLGGAMDIAANPLNFIGPGAKALGKGAEALGQAVPKIGDVIEALGPTHMSQKLTSFANEKALKAAGAMTKDFRMIQNKGLEEDLGSFLLDKKLVTPFATVSKVAERIEEAKKTAGETIGHILDTADQSPYFKVKISAAEIALHLAEDSKIQALSKVPGQERTANQINNYLETLYKNGDHLSLRDAQKLRQGIDASINFNKRVPEMSGAQPFLYQIRDTLSKTMNDAVNSLDVQAGGEAINRLKEANMAYSKLATLDKIANDRIGALSSNRAISLTDTMSGLAGAMTGHTPAQAAALGAAGALANKAARTFGPGLMATGANALSQGMAAAPGMISNVPRGTLPTLGVAGLLGGKKK